MRWCWGLLATAACYGPKVVPGSPCDQGHPCPSELVCSPATSTCEPTAASADAPGDSGTPCYGSGLVRECFQAPPTGDLHITTLVPFDTGTSTTCMLQGGMCVVAAGHVAIDQGGEVAVTGPYPLVVVSAGSIDVAGTLDAASHRALGRRGPGANPSDCVTYTDAMYPTGGPGGSFGGRGGRGGAASLLFAGHASAPAIAATALRGGCPGSVGNSNGIAVPGGDGGGAIYLIAATQITVTGTIDASGAGGAGGKSNSGGGGGGAGGMIGLDAPAILVGGGGQIFANGGGGGEGADATAGNDGADPASAATAAPGGSGGATGGGDGGAGTSGATVDAPMGGGGNASGGGGGGGAGVILVFPSQTLGGAVSPPPS